MDKFTVFVLLCVFIETASKNENCKCKRAARLFPIRRKDDNPCQCQDSKNVEYSTTASTQIPIQTSTKLTIISPTTTKYRTKTSTHIPIKTSRKITTTPPKTKTTITQLTKSTVFTTEKPSI